jgi:hypothetical protein
MTRPHRKKCIDRRTPTFLRVASVARRIALLGIGVLMALPVLPPEARAAPECGAVVGGQGSIGDSANATTIVSLGDEALVSYVLQTYGVDVGPEADTTLEELTVLHDKLEATPDRDPQQRQLLRLLKSLVGELPEVVAYFEAERSRLQVVVAGAELDSLDFPDIEDGIVPELEGDQFDGFEDGLGDPEETALNLPARPELPELPALLES